MVGNETSFSAQVCAERLQRLDGIDLGQRADALAVDPGEEGVSATASR